MAFISFFDFEYFFGFIKYKAQLIIAPLLEFSEI
jgi:hypothetical protein